ncbi:MAG: hypothetical protein JNL82_25215 [Myxococcales bacterium]|jgi:hypothetical protein|nr:hypothetical protein [Myxococcales bacterium]
MFSLRTALLAALALGTACQPYHLPGGGADDGPQIGDRGISVPVPPPSLTAAPRQEVDVDGELGDPQAASGTIVTMWIYGGAEDRGHQIVAEPDGSFHFTGIPLDLTDNCIEVWSEEPGAYGGTSVTSFFRAHIAADDQTVITEQFFSGC